MSRLTIVEGEDLMPVCCVDASSPVEGDRKGVDKAAAEKLFMREMESTNVLVNTMLDYVVESFERRAATIGSISQTSGAQWTLETTKGAFVDDVVSKYGFSEEAKHVLSETFERYATYVGPCENGYGDAQEVMAIVAGDRKAEKWIMSMKKDITGDLFSYNLPKDTRISNAITTASQYVLVFPILTFLRNSKGYAVEASVSQVNAMARYAKSLLGRLVRVNEVAEMFRAEVVTQRPILDKVLRRISTVFRRSASRDIEDFGGYLVHELADKLGLYEGRLYGSGAVCMYVEDAVLRSMYGPSSTPVASDRESIPLLLQSYCDSQDVTEGMYVSSYGDCQTNEATLSDGRTLVEAIGALVVQQKCWPDRLYRNCNEIASLLLSLRSETGEQRLVRALLRHRGDRRYAHHLISCIHSEVSDCNSGIMSEPKLTPWVLEFTVRLVGYAMSQGLVYKPRRPRSAGDRVGRRVIFGVRKGDDSENVRNLRRVLVEKDRWRVYGCDPLRDVELYLANSLTLLPDSGPPLSENNLWTGLASLVRKVIPWLRSE